MEAIVKDDRSFVEDTHFYLTWGILEIVLTKLRVYSHLLLKSPFFCNS